MDKQAIARLNMGCPYKSAVGQKYLSPDATIYAGMEPYFAVFSQGKV